MSQSEPYIETNAQPYSERTYTAQEIAQAHNVTDSTIRNRWYTWLVRVAPEPLLKQGKNFTELANRLFLEFSQVEKVDRLAWVADAKSRYSQELEEVGLIGCEIMPSEVGSVLANLQGNLDAINLTIASELGDVQQFIQSISAADAALNKVEIESYARKGVKKGIEQFKIEQISQAQTLGALRQQLISSKETN